MRTSQPSGFRPLRAGVAVAATTAAVLAGLSAPAFAANTAVTATPNTAPIGGGNTVALFGTGAFPALTATVLASRTVASTATCAGTYGTTGTTAVTTRTDDDNASVVLPALAAGTFKVCTYGVASGSTVVTGSPLVATSDTITASVANTRPVLSATSGPAVGGNTITATGAGTYLSAVTGTPAATFSTGACPATYTTTTGNVAATAVKTSTSVATITVPSTLTASTAYNVCLYGGSASNSALVGSGSATYSALPAATVSPKAGSSGVASTITVSAPSTSTFPASPSPLPGVTLTTDACPATYSTAVTQYVGPFAGTVIRINGGKIAVTLPATKIETGVGQSTTAWNVCTYANATSGALILAPATYTVAPALSVSNTISPTAGSAQGGTTVTITGTGFPYPLGNTDILSAKIGGVSLTDVTSTSATTLTGKTGAHAAGQQTVEVTTAAGTAYSSGTPFTYSYGISVSPTTAAPSATVTLDVQGAGFASLTFEDFPSGGSPDDTKAHVLLVDNSWFAPNSYVPDEAYADGGVLGECAGVIKIGDNELICTLDLTVDISAAGLAVPATPAPEGAYQVVVVNAGTGLTSATHSNVSSSSTFTVATY
ncbi:IPT/TIG domain-containing protein [Paractinoplanes durhamensis]|uniref:IPT/TIG domain-containing protein n=1 Tax=Paractinoplanes durhamensis TaxID=113563 RepID=A0ABQ3Z9S7_9ACTN|nr:IPT/TIG domain-containing protein [Actinoplanes durhamensis]GIE06581.1 hypothetical protein Adu01nite_79310 [Actinoplanes durhamensis]